MRWASRAGVALRENLAGLAVLGGACWLYAGVAGLSPPAADIVAGVLLIVVGALPYVVRLRKRTP